MRRDLAFLAAFSLLLFGWRLGTRDFWEPDEPDFALISREMLRSGDWVVPTRNGAPYAEKPPLLYWMVAGLGKASGTGVNGWTARAPSALLATLAVLCVYLAGARWLTPEAGRLGALALATFPVWMQDARWLLTDMPLAGFLAAAVLGLARGPLEGAVPPLWSFAALGLAWLSKGPLAGALAFVAVTGAGILLRRNPFPRPARWIPGGIVFLAVVLPWYLAVRQRAPAVFEEALWGQNARFLETGSHARGPLYYLGPLVYVLLPWSPAVLAGAWMAWKGRRERPGLALALAWFAGGVLLLTASSVKQVKYLLPLLPAAGLLAGWALERSALLARWTSVLGAVLLALLSGVFLEGLWRGNPGLGAAGLAALACAAALASAPLPKVLAASLCVLALAGIEGVLPGADLLKSTRNLARPAAALAMGRPLAYYGEDLQAGYPYYADRPMDYVEIGGLEAYLDRTPRAVVILRRRDLDRLPEGTRAGLRVVLERKVGSKEVVVVERAQG